MKLVGLQPAHPPPRCTNYNSPSINGQCTVLLNNGPLLCGFNVVVKELKTWSNRNVLSRDVRPIAYLRQRVFSLAPAERNVSLTRQRTCREISKSGPLVGQSVASFTTKISFIATTVYTGRPISNRRVQLPLLQKCFWLSMGWSIDQLVVR